MPARTLLVLVLLCLAPALASEAALGQTPERPNILWLVSEDNGPFIGAYGDDFATTPHIDALAAEGFLYTHAYANAPVCAPARNTIITGLYASSGGHEHMRSYYPKSDAVELFPRLLREAGYYTTNNAKEDYNLAREQTQDVWDASSSEAHYANRAPGQPFFAVFNTGLSHESSIHERKPVEELRHDPAEVPLPPYHPDTPEIRRDWAHYYDNVEDMDAWVGERLRELEESGEADNTIVFYYGDHGGVLARSKRYVYETGTHVPLVVRIPEKYRHLWPAGALGSRVDRLVSFVDLAPTILSLAGVPVPAYMQGGAFLGAQATPAPEYAFMFRGRMDERYDMSRAVRDARFRYIRNYMPYRIYGQRLDYLWRQAAIRSWEETCRRGGCNEVQEVFWNPKPVEELYDTARDPWEVNNLADDPAYADVLRRMRAASREWVLEIRDAGFIPEAELTDRAAGRPAYDYMRSGEVPLEKIVEAADRATTATAADLPRLVAYLEDDDGAVRYWGATGLRILGEQARSAVPALQAALDDPSPSVVTVAAEALYGLGLEDAGRSGFEKALQASNEFARTRVLNAIDSVGDESDRMKQAVIRMAARPEELTRQHYDHRAAKVLLDKWGVDPTEHGIAVSW